MEDLTQKLQEILGSKEGQEKLKSVADMLGAGDGKGLDFSALGDLFGGMGGNSAHEEEETKSSDPFGLEGLDINMLLKIQQMMSAMNGKNDKNAELILALKPHLRPDRQKKADDAVRIMKLLAILPMLKESGLFGGLGDLLGGK